MVWETGRSQIAKATAKEEHATWNVCSGGNVEGVAVPPSAGASGRKA